jgi:hypothetical protein
MGKHHPTSPVHAAIESVLDAVIRDVAEHFRLSHDEVAGKSFQDKQQD